MRLVLPLLLLASVAASAHADDLRVDDGRTDQTRESRYGPRSPRAQAAASAYRGPMLGWAGKVEAPAAPAAAETAARPIERPAPVAAWAGYAPAPQPQQQQVRQAQPRYVPQAAPQAAPAPQGALPTSLYSPPVARAPIAPATPRVYPSSELAGGPPPVQAAQAQAQPPRPAPVQASPAPPAPTVQTAYANPRAAEGLAPRTYSVGRMFGLTPDQIAAPGPPNTVLMAVDPAAAATAPALRDFGDEPQHGSADWLAQAAQDAGRDASPESSGTSASRKKKTRAQESDF